MPASHLMSFSHLADMSVTAASPSTTSTTSTTPSVAIKLLSWILKVWCCYCNEVTKPFFVSLIICQTLPRDKRINKIGCIKSGLWTCTFILFLNDVCGEACHLPHVTHFQCLIWNSCEERLFLCSRPSNNTVWMSCFSYSIFNLLTIHYLFIVVWFLVTFDIL